MNWIALLNLALAIMSWKWANRDFETGHTKLGWMNIVVSAVNGAAFASAVF